MSEFRLISGTVLLHVDSAQFQSQLYMFGAMPFLFVKLPSGHMSHLLASGKIGESFTYTWGNIHLSDQFRLEESYSVVSAIDIARETAKRLGVERSDG